MTCGRVEKLIECSYCEYYFRNLLINCKGLTFEQYKNECIPQIVCLHKSIDAEDLELDFRKERGNCIRLRTEEFDLKISINNYSVFGCHDRGDVFLSASFEGCKYNIKDIGFMKTYKFERSDSYHSPWWDERVKNGIVLIDKTRGGLRVVTYIRSLC